MTGLIADLRYAVRMLGRRPTYAVMAVATLALGIGATTAIYSVVRPILFEPLPYPEPDRLMMVWEQTADGPYGRTSYATAMDIAAGVRSFASVAVGDLARATLTGAAEPEPLVGQQVSQAYFPTLGVEPAIGRVFLPAEDLPGAARTVVISNGLWRRRLGGDPALVGRTISLDGRPFTVIGVMPPGFEDVLQPDAQFWTALRYDIGSSGACRQCHHLRLIARLAVGARVTVARQQLALVNARLRREYPNEVFAQVFPLVSLRDYTVRDVRTVLLTVLGAVALVLLITCVNVTNLMLGQTAQRRAELAVRTALGGSRARLARQMLTESLLLALLGGALGVALADLGVPALLALRPPGLNRLSAIGLDRPVLLFALLLATTVGLAFGLLPALQVARAGIAPDAQDLGRRTTGRSRATRGLLVVGEVALALVLLVGSGLMLQSLRRLFALSPGLDPANVLTLQIQTGGPRFASDTATWAYYDRVLAAVRAVPGVQSAGLTSQLPLSGDLDQYGVHTEPQAGQDLEIEHPGYRYAVTDGYLETLRIPLLRGRTLTAADRAGAPPVAVIGQAMAARGWGGTDPIGHRVRIGPADRGPWYTIVGVAADVMQRSLGERADNAIYVPESQMFFSDGAMSLVVRTGSDPAAMTASLRAAIRSVDQDQPIVRVATMRELVAQTEARRRFALTLFGAFAAAAIVLAAAGIYGVVAGSVSERTREIGVRTALGATGSDIVGMILRQGLTLTALGIAFGIPAAAALSRAITTLLFGTSRLDPATYLVVTGLLVGVSLLACWAPTLRAARVDPIQALRAE